MTGQRRFAQGGRIAAEEAAGFGRPQRPARRGAGAGPPGALTEQAQPGRRERGQVAGADSTVERYRRGEPAVDRVGENLQQGRIHPGAARADLVQAGEQHRAAQIGIEQRPGSCRVAAQQPQPMLRGVAARQVDGAVRADAVVRP